MKFDSSLLNNFRNFEKLKIDWSSGINLILGRNGSGKTNLLESLSIISGWGSFGKTRDVIKWGENKNSFLASKISGEQNFLINAQISSRISLRLDEKAISCTDLRLIIPSIAFLTGGVNLIDGSPSVRRFFLDKLCSLFFPPFARRLAEFKIITKNRSALLKQGRSVNPTTIPFCKIGGWIMDARRKVLNQLVLDNDDSNNSFYLKISPELTNISGYEYLENELQKNSKREIHAQRPLSGPGYDDLEIFLIPEKRPAVSALSRGQKRRLILYLIIMAGNLIQKNLKKNPVLFFDDLTAELDFDGKIWTCEQLLKTQWQIFITAPENPFKNFKSQKFGGIDFDV